MRRQRLLVCLHCLLLSVATFLVHKDMAGVRIEDTWNTLGMRGTGSNDLVLEDVHIPADHYLDQAVPVEPGMQPRQAIWGLLIAAVYLGIAQGARNEALRFARQRRPNSLKQQSIASVPHIQDKVGRMEIALLESKSLLFSLAEQYCDEPDSVGAALVGAAKFSATNHAVEIVDIAMRIVGAASLALTSPLQRYYRDVRAGLHNPPMDDAALAALAKKVLEPPDTDA
jgi:alkylation response protein AidB-like acyl-CoA dehydrogenase